MRLVEARSRFLIACAIALSLGLTGGCADSDSAGENESVADSLKTNRSDFGYGLTDRQAIAWVSAKDGSIETSGSSFMDVPGLARLFVCKPYLTTTATVSLVVRGGQGEIRAISFKSISDSFTLEPGSVPVEASDAWRSISFTFSGSQKRAHDDNYSVQWRAASADNPLELLRGSLRVIYGNRPGEKDTCA